MVVVKYDNESFFREYDNDTTISTLVWTGNVEEAKRFDGATNGLMDLIEILIEEEYLPFTIEEVDN
jgi:hypothetical protein